MRKYNEALSGMVQNYRDLASEKGISTAHLTNEQVFAIIEFWSGCSTSEEQTEAVLEDLKDNQVR